MNEFNLMIILLIFHAIISEQKENINEPVTKYRLNMYKLARNADIYIKIHQTHRESRVESHKPNDCEEKSPMWEINARNGMCYGLSNGYVTCMRSSIVLQIHTYRLLVHSLAARNRTWFRLNGKTADALKRLP